MVKSHSLPNMMKIFQGNALSCVSVSLGDTHHRSDPPEAKRRKRNDDGYNEFDDDRIFCCNAAVLPMSLDAYEDIGCTNDSTIVMVLEPSPQAFVETLLKVCTLPNKSRSDAHTYARSISRQKREQEPKSCTNNAYAVCFEPIPVSNIYVGRQEMGQETNLTISLADIQQYCKSREIQLTPEARAELKRIVSSYWE